MKKNKKATLISICLAPLLLLTACVPPASYTITASSSDTQLGYVHGFDKNAVEEGNKVTLSAVSTSENAFLCWIKDNKKIVSQEEKLTLIYNSNNQGHYTALFEEKDTSKMLYANLTEINFEPSGFTSVEYTLSTALLSSGSSDYYEFAYGEFVIGDEHTTDINSVMYFGGAGDEYVYLIKIAFKLYDSNNAETSYEYQLQTRIEKDSFNSEGLFIVEEKISAFESNLNLTFSKLNSHIFQYDET